MTRALELLVGPEISPPGTRQVAILETITVPGPSYCGVAVPGRTYQRRIAVGMLGPDGKLGGMVSADGGMVPSPEELGALAPWG